MQECHEVARDTIIINKNKSKGNYDRTMNPLAKESCKKILLKNNQAKNKLASKWDGPYEIIEWHDNGNMTIRKNNKNIRVHTNNVKAFNE